jgi:choline dehydrogenase-like flavoprotein
METDPKIRVLLHANVVDICTDATAKTVSNMQISTLEGNKFDVFAKYFVLATGGIENARLLLASNQSKPCGLGNDQDLVGRFFMDHPRLQTGQVQFRDQWRSNLLYDIKYHKTRLIAAHGTAAAVQFVLKPEVVRAEGLLQARVWFRSVFIRENSPRVEALYRFAHNSKRSEHTGLLRKIASTPSRSAKQTLHKVFATKPFLRGVNCEIIVEPDPNPDSRITLAAEKDSLGVPRARVNWQLGPLVQKTVVRTLDIVSSELRRAGVADISLPKLFPDDAWPEDLLGTWHHMGTTRMSDSPNSGVVDRNCRVHGMENLFVAGSSVFPTGGGNFPTMTLTALAIRLADHLQAVLQNDSSNPQKRNSDAAADVALNVKQRAV